MFKTGQIQHEQFIELTSECLEPHEKKRCLGFADFPHQPLYSYNSVDMYTHLGILW